MDKKAEKKQPGADQNIVQETGGKRDTKGRKAGYHGQLENGEATSKNTAKNEKPEKTRKRGSGSSTPKPRKEKTPGKVTTKAKSASNLTDEPLQVIPVDKILSNENQAEREQVIKTPPRAARADREKTPPPPTPGRDASPLGMEVDDTVEVVADDREIANVLNGDQKVRQVGEIDTLKQETQTAYCGSHFVTFLLDYVFFFKYMCLRYQSAAYFLQ